jgi:cobalamin biosynthesis protein CobT
VAVYVGHGFDASKVLPDTHFKIVAVLRDSQAAQLVEAGVLPEWMTLRDASATAETPDEGFVFDYTDAKGVEEEDDEDEDEEEDDEEEETKTPAPAPPSAAQKTKSGKPNHRAAASAAMNVMDEEGTAFSFE